MRILPVSEEATNEALRILAAGGIVAHATETCYGLACDLSNPAAVTKLFAIKERSSGQPVSALFPSVKEAKNYVAWNDRAEALAHQHLPGPLTLILQLRKDAPLVFPIPTPTPNPIPNPIPTPNPTLALRISSHPLAQALAARFGKPLSTTSANLHGRPSPYSAQEIERQFASASAQPDLILDSGELPPVPPSTIIDLTQRDETRTRRQGGLSV